MTEVYPPTCGHTEDKVELTRTLTHGDLTLFRHGSFVKRVPGITFGVYKYTGLQDYVKLREYLCGLHEKYPASVSRLG